MALEGGPPRAPEPSEEGLIFARLLVWGTRISIAFLLLSFVLYLTGGVEALIPIGQLPRYWAMPAVQYLQEAGLPSGWGWVALISFGDFMNFLGIAMLGGVTVVCYLAILPALLRSRDTAYALIVLAQIVVLLLAASGLLAVGR